MLNYYFLNHYSVEIFGKQLFKKIIMQVIFEIIPRIYSQCKTCKFTVLQVQFYNIIKPILFRLITLTLILIVCR